MAEQAKLITNRLSYQAMLTAKKEAEAAAQGKAEPPSKKIAGTMTMVTGEDGTEYMVYSVPMSGLTPDHINWKTTINEKGIPRFNGSVVLEADLPQGCTIGIADTEGVVRRHKVRTTGAYGSKRYINFSIDVDPVTE